MSSISKSTTADTVLVPYIRFNPLQIFEDRTLSDSYCMQRIRDHIHIENWELITHPCPNFFGDLVNIDQLIMSLNGVENKSNRRNNFIRIHTRERAFAKCNEDYVIK